MKRFKYLRKIPLISLFGWAFQVGRAIHFIVTEYL